MEPMGLSVFLLMGLGLGMVHAFDPDHIAAVGGLTAGNGRVDTPGNIDTGIASKGHQVYLLRSTPIGSGDWLRGFQWSLGHATALLVISLAVFVAGTAIPQQLSIVAEHSVAYMLIFIGLTALLRLSNIGKQKKETFTDKRTNKQGFSAPLVGLIHGTAGSAPLLALIPISQLAQPQVGLVYVLFFSAGVMLSMSAMGGALAWSLRSLHRFDAIYWRALQVLMAGFSLFLGVYLAFQV
ncbi:urease accessory protein UreH [Teredinibacter waterburyi]|jgi:hypothetical protein|uniref:urease accessory protein UreH n=1 Tax=Teredinibacter waterburyi TaxID=1500538 RepID=UPI00165FE4C6|nr:urease accessory protein UreH [Teredinibacter waterburyi]